MEKPNNSVYHQEKEENNPILVFLSNLFVAIKLPFPQKNGDVEIEPAAASSQAEEPTKINPAEVEDESNKPGVVTFPRHRCAPLKLEGEAEGAERSTNPVILWQVYAIGGFYILRWAWARWNERKGQTKSEDEPPPACD